MNFIEAVKSVYSNYANFQGRARRSEYWWFFLFVFIVAFILSAVETMVTGTMFLYLIFLLASIIPSIAVQVRRLHDTGRSGWWILLSFIPLVGPIVLIVFYVMDSEAGVNKYGPNPKGVIAAAADAVTGG
ncbi:MAG: Integral membrane protein [Oceanicaulis sp. HLUCCA04]|nr:MAG: Integral membrane protein [Oceanicaulis sp. HLUCCA04]